MSVTFGMILIFITGVLIGKEIERTLSKEQATKNMKAFFDMLKARQAEAKQENENKGEEK